MDTEAREIALAAMHAVALLVAELARAALEQGMPPETLLKLLDRYSATIGHQIVHHPSRDALLELLDPLERILGSSVHARD